MSIITATLLGGLLLSSPPAGRPPTGPLQRYEPKIYDLTFQVQLQNTIRHHRIIDPAHPPTDAPAPHSRTDEPIDIADTPIVMPIILQGTFHQIDHRSLDGELWLNGRAVPDLNERSRLDDGYPHHLHMAIMVIDRFRGTDIRWRMKYRVQAFSSRIDDRAAAQVPWPREWPDEVADGLQPQKYIESDDPIFAQTLQRITQGSLRLVPPYLAAKDIVRYCVNEIQVSGSGTLRGELGVIRAMNVHGAKHAATTGRGTPHDLVCVCIAMLKAAGIPARPVIGVEEDEKKRGDFVSWGEFYLPDTGWVPFDPMEMRGVVRTRDVRAAWPEFATMDELNERVPLSYYFIPPASVETPYGPAVWGWDPRPSGARPGPSITLDLTSRGAGVKDPH